MLRTLAILGLAFLGLSAQGVGPSGPLPQPALAQALMAMDDRDRVVLKGNTHPAVTTAVVRGRPSGDLAMEHLLLSLSRTPSAQAQLDTFLAAQQDPASPQYHQWLTPAQFGATFGPTPETLQLVTAWLEAQGFRIDEVAPGGMTIQFSGSCQQVEAAFQTLMLEYEVDGVNRLANAMDPSIPRALAGMVRGLVSLHNFPKHAYHATPRPLAALETAPSYTNGSTHYLFPADFATIYNLGPLYAASLNGSGTTIAIVARSNIKVGDVTSFRNLAGLTANNPTIVLNGVDPGYVTGDQDETTLDTEWAGAIAPGAAVQVVVSKSTGTSDGVDLSAQYIVNNNLAQVVSVSYGACENNLGTTGNAFLYDLWAQAAAQGITVLVSSGDSGPAGCDSSSATTGTIQAVNGLASTPANIAVGGTEFHEGVLTTYWNPTNNANQGSATGYIPELPWDESPAGATYPGSTGLWAGGGGVSILYPKPVWQVAPGVPTDGMRDVPDVALTAAGHDGYYVQENGNGYLFSGTSAAAPSMAGIMAILVQKNGARLGNANVRLYELGNAQYGASATPVFHDITSGNDNVPGVLGFTATPGYDQATGLGSVDATALVNNWNTGVAMPVVTSFTPALGQVGAVLNLTGTGFTNATSVKINGTATNYTVASDTAITATVPTGATTGKVAVTNAAGTGTSAASFTVGAAGPPGISSFSPAYGSALTFVRLTGWGFLGATAVKFNGTAAYSFTVVSDGAIEAKAPSPMTTGPITVTTPAGSSTSATPFTAPPAIASFTPASGPAGTVVTLTGTDFANATGIKFHGLAGTAFALVSGTSAQATVPIGATTGTLTITTPAGTGTSLTTFTVPAPTVTSFTPTTGPAGTVVTLTGTGFSSATAVKFNTTSALTFTVVSDTSLTATVPPGATTGPVAVTSPNGTGTSSGSFTAPAPAITSFTPTSGPVGTSVTITGAGFTGATAVKFNGTAATTVTVTSDLAITATVPPGTTTGPIAVTTPNGTGTSTGSFTVPPLPTITSFTPASGQVGTLITLTGTAFTGATAVKFNGTPAATFAVVSDTTLTATVAAGTTTGTVAVTTPNGTAVSTSSFTALVPPAITSFTPASGPAGTAVTLTGTGFTGATAVKFNGSASTFNVASDTSVTATVPAGATTGTLAVTTPYGTGTSTGAFTVQLPPGVTSFTPTSGPVGTMVTLTGTGFTGATAVKFNSTAASSFNVVSDTALTATVPAGATTGTLAVTTPNGTGTSTNSFNVLLPPAVTSFAPATGPVGTPVTLTGTGFTGATAVKFNGTPATTFNVASDTSATATVPAGATTGTLAVTTPNGTGMSTGAFTVQLPPVVTSFTPTSGPAGTGVTLTGTGFTGATAVKFNGTAAFTYTIGSDTAITATVPAGATTGTITVVSTGGSGTSTASFTVLLPPVINAFTPTIGPAGSSVTLTGAGFTGATAVKFNGTAATTFTVGSDTSITVTVPSGAASGTIAITTPGGTGSSPGAFTVLAPPVIASFTPASGLAGAQVTLTGTGFTGATSVQFNGTAASTFTIGSDTAITVTVPAGAATGPITVTAPGGTGASAGSFTVLLPPVVTSFTPASGPAGTRVTLTGSGFSGASSVTFNGNAAATFAVVSDLAITVTVPAGTTTGAVSVTTPNGTGTSPGAFTITASNTAIKTLDLNGDGTLDILDLALLARAYGSTASSPNWNPAADLNGDGVVDDADVALFLAGL